MQELSDRNIDWIDLAQSVEWQLPRVNAVMKLRGHKKT